jgi:hypothetical protein
MREGKRRVTFPVTPADHKRLKVLAAELEMTIEALLVEGLEDLFAKHAPEKRRSVDPDHGA